MVTDDILFHFFPTFDHLPYGPKITRIIKIYIATSKSSLSEVNFSTSWINTLGHILLDTTADFPVCFKIITNIIYSDLSPRMVVPFILVPLY